jgi:hypothetical protein
MIFKSIPLAALSIVDARLHCCVSMWPNVNQRGYRLRTNEETFPLTGSSASSCSSRIGNLHGKYHVG